MATMTEAVRRLTIETVERGADQAKAKLAGLAGAQREVAAAGDAVTAATEKSSRAMVSVERAFARAQTRYDAVARAERELANVHKLVASARAQGIGTEEAYQRLLTSVTTRHAAATTAINTHAAAVRSLSAANQNAARTSGGQGLNTANVAAQFQDIGVTAAMGMNPLQIALQQGTQLSQVFGQTGASGAVRTLGAAFMSLVSPVSLVTIGLTAAAAAGIQYFMSAKDGASSADEALRKHEEAIASVAARWGQVIPELQRYADENAKARDMEALRQAAQEQTNRLLAEARTQMSAVAEEMFRLNTALLQSSDGAAAIASLETSFGNLQAKLSDGTARAGDLKAVQDSLSASFTATGIPAVGQLADIVGALAQRFAEAANNAATLNEQTATALMRESLPAMPPRIGPVLSAGGTFIDQDQLQTIRANATKSQTRLAAERAGQDPRVERIRSMQQAVELQRLEMSLIGATAGEAAALRSEFQWLSAAREDAARKGIAVDEAEIRMIKLKAAELRDLIDLNASRSLMNDLAFERAQLGRSGADQQIASRLRGAGLPVDLNSPEARAMRENMQFSTIQGDVSTFFNDFRQALVSNGGNLGEALSLSVQNAAMRAFDRTMEDLIITISNMIAEAASGRGGLGGGSGGSIIGSLVGTLFGGSSVSLPNTAPIPTAAPRMSRGGVARTPSVISEYGQPEAAVPLPDGRRIPVDLTMPDMRGPDRALPAGPLVNVQVINNASNTRAREERSAGPDGREMRRIIIEEVKGEMASGGFDGVMTGRYGASPQRVAR